MDEGGSMSSHHRIFVVVESVSGYLFGGESCVFVYTILSGHKKTESVCQITLGRREGLLFALLLLVNEITLIK